MFQSASSIDSQSKARGQDLISPKHIEAHQSSRNRNQGSFFPILHDQGDIDENAEVRQHGRQCFMGAHRWAPTTENHSGSGSEFSKAFGMCGDFAISPKRIDSTQPRRTRP